MRAASCSELLHRFDEWSDQQAVVQLVVFFLRVVWDIHTHWRCLHVLIRLEDLLGNQSVRRFTLKRVCWLEFGNELHPWRLSGYLLQTTIGRGAVCHGGSRVVPTDEPSFSWPGSGQGVEVDQAIR